jgi:hypothetical protein
VEQMSFAKDGDKIASADDNSNIIEWDASTGKVSSTYTRVATKTKQVSRFSSTLLTAAN